jgi:hypothetical protein
MRVLSCLVLFCFGLAAQAPSDKAAVPPEVDQALRARIQKFYQAHVDGKFRVADEVVAEDSKDFFFEMEKVRYLSFEIAKIDYSENFTRATATVNCEEEMTVPMVGARTKVKRPLQSTWKLVDGQWWWYAKPPDSIATPFGIMKVPQQGTAQASSPGVVEIPKGPSVGDVQNAVKPDKNVIRLKFSEPSSDVVTLSNGMPGGVDLTLDAPPVAGLELKFDRAQIGQNEAARLTVSYTPAKDSGPKPPAKFSVIVEPTEQVIPFQVLFVAPENPPAPPATSAPPAKTASEKKKK